MKIGKLSESALQKVVFEQLHTRRDEVLVGPGIGEDCAALKLQEGEVFVTSTDPITGSVKDTVAIDEEGKGRFLVKGGKLAVWVKA